MSKKGGNKRPIPSGGALPGGMNMGSLVSQMQKMQEDMRIAQEELEKETLEVSVGGGALTIVITGHQRVQAIKINKDVLDLDDENWLTDLEDLLLAGVNQAIEQSQTRAAERMEAIGGGLAGAGGLGGLLGL